MTQDNPTANPNPDPSQPAESPAGKPLAGKPKKKRRWIRRIVFTLLILIIGLFVLVALTPTLLSTGSGRNFVVGKINQNLNGHISIDNWSIGWTGGIHADEVKVFDDAGKQILHIPRFGTEVSLIGALRGKIHLGNTTVEGVDFFAERYPDGTLNFSRLAKNGPPVAQVSQNTPTDKFPKLEATETTEKSARADKLPSIDGEVHLVNCKGIFQDDIDKNTRKIVEFSTIAGDIKIPNINSTIEDSLKIVANMDGHELMNFDTSGKVLIASNNVMLPPGQMTIQQSVKLNADLALAQQGFGAQQPPTAPKLIKGTITTDIEVTGDATALHIKPTIKARDIALVVDGVADPIGNTAMVGEIVLNYAPPSGKSLIDQIASLQFNNFQVLGVGSGLAINGPIDDPMHSRVFKNLTVGLDYNAGMLWNAILPLLDKDTQKSLKDTKVVGSFTDKKRKVWTFNGPFPADKEFNQAIIGFTANGEIALDLLDSNGATLSDFVVPFSLADGKLRLAYPKGTPKEFAEPAHLNGGTLSLAGLEVDFTTPHPVLSVPDKTQFLDNVSLNALFASTFLGGDLNNPLFSGADKASGQLSIEFAHCHDFPLDATATLNVPANKGVLELNLKIVKLELGSVLVARISEAMGPLKSVASLAGSKFKLDSLHGDVTDFNVLIQQGITKQHLMMTVGDKHERGLKLAGSVVMATRMMDMLIEIPMSTFGLKSGNPDSDIKIPMSGPVDKPKLNTSDAVKNALKHVKGIPDISGLLNKGDKSTTGPADQGKENPADLLGDLFGKKKKDKKKDNPDSPQN